MAATETDDTGKVSDVDLAKTIYRCTEPPTSWSSCCEGVRSQLLMDRGMEFCYDLIISVI